MMLGREGEVATLERALADGVRGSGRFLLVTGEPGIGKTTLVEWLVSRAAEEGVDAGVGRAWEGAGAPPWFVWREALRGLDVELTLPRTSADRDDVRFACLETVVETVRDVASASPIVLVLDDLQWADVSSLLAAKLLARSLAKLPVLFVGTLRDPISTGDDTGAVLADLRREATTLRLCPLGRAEIAALAMERGLDGPLAVDRTLGISVSPPRMTSLRRGRSGARGYERRPGGAASTPALRQQRLYFLPEPHGHVALRATREAGRAGGAA